MHNQQTRARWLVLTTLCIFGTIVPTASADTGSPVWTCRASAAYVEVDPVLSDQRVEPVLANGRAVADNPATAVNESDSPQCNTTDAGTNDIDILPGPGPLVDLTAAFARTEIAPPLGAARTQTATSAGGVSTTTITVAGITIQVDTAEASARALCTGIAPNQVPTLTGRSEVVNLRIAGIPLNIPDGGAPFELVVPGVLSIRLNRQITTGDANTPQQELIQRAAQIEVLPAVGTDPLALVVIGEAKVDRTGAVCAPPPPLPTCPAPSIPQAGSNPLVCVLPVVVCAPGSTPNPNDPNTCVLTCPAPSVAGPNGACVVTNTVVGPPAPCPAGTSNDPNAAGACIRALAACPTGTTRDPNSTACILLVQRPCPAGAVADPQTRVCVVSRTRVIPGENGRIGGPDGPIATCGRLQMRFVRGMRSLGQSFTSRFGNRAVTRGRLVTCGSNPRPIVGARVDVVHLLPPGDKPRRKTGLRSRPNGLLTLILPIDLRSRKISYAYRPDLRSTRVTSRVILRLTVRNKAGRILR